MPSIDDSQFDGLSSLVRLSGSQVPARARFVGETLLTATLSSLTFGLVCGQVGGVVLFDSVGPLIPFLIGSWTGYSFGLWNQWRTASRTTLHYAERYPMLLRHALREEWATEVDDDNLPRWIAGGGLSRQTLAILAATSCRSAVEDLIERERQKLVEAHCEREEE